MAYINLSGAEIGPSGAILAPTPRQYASRGVPKPLVVDAAVYSGALGGARLSIGPHGHPMESLGEFGDNEARNMLSDLRAVPIGKLEALRAQLANVLTIKEEQSDTDKIAFVRSSLLRVDTELRRRAVSGAGFELNATTIAIVGGVAIAAWLLTTKKGKS